MPSSQISDDAPPVQMGRTEHSASAQSMAPSRSLSMLSLQISGEPSQPSGMPLAFTSRLSSKPGQTSLPLQTPSKSLSLPGPHSRVQLKEQPSPARRLPSSQASPASIVPLPQMGGPLVSTAVSTAVSGAVSPGSVSAVASGSVSAAVSAGSVSVSAAVSGAVSPMVSPPPVSSVVPPVSPVSVPKMSGRPASASDVSPPVQAATVSNRSEAPRR